MGNTIFWFRRDLRLEDNTALSAALAKGKRVLPIFIFDDDIVNELPINDARVTFIYQLLRSINDKLNENGISLLVLKGKVQQVWVELIHNYQIDAVYINRDYEPYAIKRDKNVEALLQQRNIKMYSFKDQVIHEKTEIVKNDGKPYTIYTPYKNKWLNNFGEINIKSLIDFSNFHQYQYKFPTLESLGFIESTIKVKGFSLSCVDNYASLRDFPSQQSTNNLGPHLRFGSVSIRSIINQLQTKANVFLSELIWREFFMQILYHYPEVVKRNFRRKYDGINWINKEKDFEKWCNGLTGYPMVDAGMRELNATGYMHNRVRMVTAGFLCKHLLIDWRLGEAYFAQKLLDYDLASNNGNWQWAAGTGCDAAPYFRIFNPTEQLKKFDKDSEYVKKWIPELGTKQYPKPMIDHAFARNRAIEKYKKEMLSF